jgi:hypothetical protein
LSRSPSRGRGQQPPRHSSRSTPWYGAKLEQVRVPPRWKETQPRHPRPPATGASIGTQGVGGGGTPPRPRRPGCRDPFVTPPLSSTSSLLAPSSCTKGGARGTATVSSEGREKRRRGEEEQRGVAKRGLTTSPMGLHPGFFLSRAGPSGLCHSTLFSGGRRRASMVPV